MPFSLLLIVKIASAAEALIPADTLPAGFPTAVILAIVLKYLLLVAVPAFAPVTVSVCESPLTSVPTTVNDLLESSPAERIVISLP